MTVTTIGSLLSTDEVFLVDATGGGNSVTSNTTPAQVTGLEANLVSGKKYYFKAFFNIVAAVTPGWKLGIDGSCTVSSMECALYVWSPLAQTSDYFTALASSSGANHSGTFRAGLLEGTCECSGNGTLYPTFAQNTSSLTSVSISGAFIVTEIA